MKLKTKHLFGLLDILKKTGVFSKVKEFYAQVQGAKGSKDSKEVKAVQEELGIDIVVAIASGIGGAEDEIYELLADLDDTTVEIIENQDPKITIDSIKEIFTSEAFTSFLAIVTE